VTDATLADVLKEAIDGRISEHHTCIPALIVSYDRNKQSAVVQPSLKRKYKDGRIVNLPIINNVPVIFPRNKNNFIHFDLEKNDVVTLIFSERSLDIWKEKGGIVSPNDPRKGNLSDAYALVGGFDFKQSFTPTAPSGSLEINNSGNVISIEKSGQITIKNNSIQIIAKQNGDLDIINGSLTINAKNSGKISISNGSDELISLLSDLLTEIIGAKTLTLLGLQPLIGLTQTFPALKAKIDGFKV